MADLPPIAQNPDIRFLGKLLGDVIRAYGGEELYARTEAIRAASDRRNRANEEGGGADVPLPLGELDLDQPAPAPDPVDEFLAAFREIRARE